MKQRPDDAGRQGSCFWIGIGLLAVVVASAMPLSHDEAFWLAITRKVEAGARLYDGAIDNKPPSVYLVMYLLDRVPGDFQLARGILVGGLIGSIGVLAAHLGIALGGARRISLAVGIVAAATIALLTEFVFAVELPALSALLGSLWLITRKRASWAAGVAVLAASFDPRALLMLPGLVLFAANQAGRPAARQFARWAGALTVLGIAIVVLQPDLRYGLIELNLGSRTSAGGWRPVEQLAVALRSLLPLLVAGLLLRPSAGLLRNRAFVGLAAGGLTIGFLSLLPFDHYWAYCVPALIFLTSGAGQGAPRTAPVFAAAFLATAFAPLIVNTVTTSLEQHEVTAGYAEAAVILGGQLQEPEQFVSFDIKPYMATNLPVPHALRSPVAGYLVWPTSRTARYVDELPSLIDSSVAISEDGGLKASQNAVSEDYRPVWETFQERLGDFPCVVETAHVILRFRIERCPQP